MPITNKLDDINHIVWITEHFEKLTNQKWSGSFNLCKMPHPNFYLKNQHGTSPTLVDAGQS